MSGARAAGALVTVAALVLAVAVAYVAKVFGDALGRVLT